MSDFTRLDPTEYPIALGLYGRYCPWCLHYVSERDRCCDICKRRVGPVVKIREHGEALAGRHAFCGSTE